MTDVSFAVDVSAHQDARQPWKNWGIHLGFAKASEGERSWDGRFPTHIADIKAAGLIPAAYHFAWPNQDALVEAANYIAAVRDHTLPVFVHALDLERYPNGGRNYAGRSGAQIRQYAHDWIAKVKAAFPGQKVGIYTSGDDILDGHLPGNEDFLWYPAYPVQGRTFAQAAAAPRPRPSGRTVWGWQFTSVPRDQTVIYMSPTALRTWAAGDTPHPEDPMPLTDAEIDKVAAAVAEKVRWYQVDDPFKAGTEQTTLGGLWWETATRVAKLSTQPPAGAPALSDEQLAQLAAKVAADPVLASAIAEQVAVKLAARLQA